MKQQSIEDLWIIKKMVPDCPRVSCGTAIIERINKVLIEEDGAGAALYVPEWYKQRATMLKAVEKEDNAKDNV